MSSSPIRTTPASEIVKVSAYRLVDAESDRAAAARLWKSGGKAFYG